MIISLKFTKMVGPSFLQTCKRLFLKTCNLAQLEALALVEKVNGNVRNYDLKVETLVKQGWNKEYASGIKLSTSGHPTNAKDFAIERQGKHSISSLEPSLRFHSRVNMVASEVGTLEKKLKRTNSLLKIIISSIFFSQNLLKYKL